MKGVSPRTWSAAPPASRASRPLSARSVLHLLTLSTLAVAHPLYALLRVEEHAPFLAAHHAQAVDLWLLATVVSIGFPAVLLATLGLVQLVSRRLARWVYGFLLFTLFAMLFAPIPERLLGEMGRTAPAIALGAAAATTWLYFAGSAVRSFVTFMSVAVVASPLYFASGASVRPILWPAEALDHATILSGAHLPDVVMIVLDELPVTSILDTNEGQVSIPNDTLLGQEVTIVAADGGESAAPDEAP